MAELKRLRTSGLTIHEALDEMRGRDFTFLAITDALNRVEGMSFADIHRLFDERGDWDDF